MYKSFFGLGENPFNVNPDPRFLFRTRSIEESLASLAYGIRARKGFILLTGEVGTGKTTLVNRLMDWLHHQQVATAFIFNTQIKASHLLDFILSDFGIPSESREKSQMLLALSRWLLERYRAGEIAVLVIDEAQNLSPRVLEEIRLLTNLETSTEKLLQIVLSGQPELEEKLRQPGLRQLKQRITLRCKTMPLSLEETRGYILERLRIAGSGEDAIFSPEAIEGVYRSSRGIPRLINLICENALINAYAESIKPVPGRLVDEVVREFQLDESPLALTVNRSFDPPRDDALRELVQALERFRKVDSFSTDSGEKAQ